LKKSFLGPNSYEPNNILTVLTNQKKKIRKAYATKHPKGKQKRGKGHVGHVSHRAHEGGARLM